MIKKLHEEWDRLSVEARQSTVDPERHQEIVERMKAVSGALRQMAQGNVTRQTLSQAVRDQLQEILKSERDSLFPELSKFNEELTNFREAFERNFADLRQRSDGVDEPRRAGRIEELAAADDQLAEGLKDLESRLSGRNNELESATASRVEALEASLRQSLAGVETRVTEARGKLETQFEDLVQKQIARHRSELSVKLKKNDEAIEDLKKMENRIQNLLGTSVAQLEDKINSLFDIASDIQANLPPREAIEGLEERLVGIESRLRSVSDQVEGLKGSMPNVDALGGQLEGIHGEVVVLASELASTHKENRDTSDVFLGRVQELQDLLRSTQDRLNADRSVLRQKVVDLRDTMRDQVRLADSRQSSPPSLVDKILARPEGGLKLDPEEWDKFRASLNTIAQELESLLTDGKSLV